MCIFGPKWVGVNMALGSNAGSKSLEKGRIEVPVSLLEVAASSSRLAQDPFWYPRSLLTIEDEQRWTDADFMFWLSSF